MEGPQRKSLYKRIAGCFSFKILRFMRCMLKVHNVRGIFCVRNKTIKPLEMETLHVLSRDYLLSVKLTPVF